MSFKKSVVVTNSDKPKSRLIGGEVAEFLRGRGVEPVLHEFNGFDDGFSFEGADFAVTLGGDGTVLYAARSCVALGVPVFPVNLGEFGFIAGAQADEWRESLGLFLDGRAAIDSRSMVRAAVVSGGSSRFVLALNDIVVSSRAAARTVSMSVSYNMVPLGEYKADGVIIATSTGSTAYSASAGGPIIDPALDAFVVTPINAFSLSSRPLVLPADGEISVAIMPSRAHGAMMTADGQEPEPLRAGDRVKIRRESRKVSLVGCDAKKFYGALRAKLNWAGGPHAGRSCD